MGQYAMSATSGVVGYSPDAAGNVNFDAGLPNPDGGPCSLVEVTATDFSFDAILTRDSASEVAWITLNTYSREGTFDGQVLSSETSATRVFAACGECTTRLVETISVAVLSRSQNEATSAQCPADPLVDGGVPFNPDAGIVAPGQTSQGYDAVRLCGELTTTVVAVGLSDGGACDRPCGGCTVRHHLRGDRR